MNEIPSFPESISHKKLNKFLSHAQKGPKDEANINIEFQEERQNFEELLNNWSSISKDLLESLKKSENHLKKIKASKSLLALGAMEAHINMALQALRASETEEE